MRFAVPWAGPNDRDLSLLEPYLGSKMRVCRRGYLCDGKEVV